MKLIRPITIDETNLQSSNISEDDADTWSATDTYAENDEVLYEHRVYQSLIDDNTGSQPDTGAIAETPSWLDLGPANRYRMFDVSPSSTSQRAGTIEFVVVPGQTVDAVGLINLSALSVTVERLSSSGIVVYTETKSLEDVDALGDGVTDYLTDVVFLDLPLSSLRVRIAIDASGGTAKCGAVIIGRQGTIGDTEFGASIGITDYSRKDTDDFGDTTIVKRAYAKTGDFSIKLDTARLGAVQRALARLRAEPALYVGVSYRSETILYGFYRSFTLVLEGPTRSSASIEIESLTYEGSDALFPDATIDTPSITAPTADGTLATNGTLVSSAFATTPEGNDTHYSSDWQVATDSAFSTSAYSVSGSTTDLTSHTIADGSLSSSTEYYARVRHHGVSLGASAWSAGVHFTTDAPEATVDQPSITNPASNGDTYTSAEAITSSAFSVTGDSDTHASSDWQISSSSAFSTVAVESLTDTTNLTNWTPSASNLTDGETYYLRVRHRGATYGNSAWSSVRSFVFVANDFSLDDFPAGIIFRSGSSSSVAALTITIQTTGAWTIGKSSGDSSGTWNAGDFSASDYECKFSVVSSDIGTGSTETNGAQDWTTLSSDVALSIVTPFNSSNGAGEYSADWRLSIREIADTSNLISADFSLTGVANG